MKISTHQKEKHSLFADSHAKGRRSTRNRKGSLLSAPKSEGDDAEFDGVDFESRFQNMFAEQENGLLRAKTRRLRDRAGAQA